MLSAGHAKPVTMLERGGPFSTQLAVTTGTEAKQERDFGGLEKKEHFKILGLSHKGPVGWGNGEGESTGMDNRGSGSCFTRWERQE